MVWTEAHMARSSLTDVEKDSLTRPALVFTDSDSLACTVKKDVGPSHDKMCRIIESMLREKVLIGGGHFADVVVDSFASRGSLDENDGEGHACRFLQLVVSTSL